MHRTESSYFVGSTLSTFAVDLYLFKFWGWGLNFWLTK